MRRVLGYADKLDFDAETLRLAYERNYGWRNLTILAAGAVTSAEVVQGVETYFDNRFPDAQSDQSQLPPPHVGLRITGLVNDRSNNLRVMHNIPLDERMRDAYLEDDGLAFNIAADALKDIYAGELRFNAGISYSADLGFKTYNHPDCWTFQAGTIIDAEKLPIARRIFSDLLKAGPDAVSDEALIAARAVVKGGLAAGLDSPKERIMDHTKRLAVGAEPHDLERYAARAKDLSLGDIRNSLNTIFQFFTSTPLFEHLTGNRENIGGVDQVIERSQIA